jgi:hypothetical protein
MKDCTFSPEINSKRTYLSSRTHLDFIEDQKKFERKKNAKIIDVGKSLIKTSEPENQRLKNFKKSRTQQYAKDQKRSFKIRRTSPSKIGAKPDRKHQSMIAFTRIIKQIIFKVRAVSTNLQEMDRPWKRPNQNMNRLCQLLCHV